MITNHLANLSVLKAFTESRKDILECLLPFLEYAIVEIGTEYIETQDIKEKIKEDCGLDIPFSTIKTLLKKLKRSNHITTYENFANIKIVRNFTMDNNDYKDKMQVFSRETTAFVVECRKFCSFIDCTEEDVSEKIYAFIQSYQSYIDISEGNIDISNKLSSIEEDNERITNFILHINEYNNNHYSTFKNIFYGFILSGFISENMEIANKSNLSYLNVYIDSNFLLRVLNLQAPPYFTASKELLDLMKNCGIKVLVIPEVLQEVKTVLYRNQQQFVREREILSELHGLKVNQLDGVIGAFFRRKMGFTDIVEYIDNIENELAKLGVQQANVMLPETFNEKEQSKIEEYKIKNNNINSISNVNEQEIAKSLIIRKSTLDARILNFVRNQRKHSTTKLGSCKALFLTCDNVICSVNAFYHKQNRTIPEAISETKLTNILFISNMRIESNAPISLLVSIFKSSSYLSYELLIRFHTDLKNYLANNPSESQYLSNLLNNQELFSEIESIYDNEDYTNEVLELKDIFEKAKEKEATIQQSSELQKKEMQKQIDSLTDKVAQLSVFKAEDLSLETKELKEEMEGKNVVAEKMLKNGMTFFCILLLLSTAILAFLNVEIDFSDISLNNFVNVFLWITPFFLSIALTLNLLNEKFIEKNIDRYIYNNSTDSFFLLYFVLILKSLWAFLPLALTFFATYISTK